MSGRDIRLWIDTLRHLRPSQLVYRCKERLHRARVLASGKSAKQRLSDRRRKSGIEFTIPSAAGVLQQLIQRRVEHRPHAWNLQRAEVLTFLSESLAIGIPPLWKEGNQLRKAKDRALWMFHLHYHDWMWDLYAADWKNSIQACLSDWIESNPLGCEHSFRGPWSPYTISRRLPNWCLLLSLPILSGTDRTLITESLIEQVIYLDRHIEWEHGANHLLENLLSLVLIGAFLSGERAKPMTLRHVRLLLRELDRQLLKDGMHEERCPGYHAHILWRLEELALLYNAINHSAARRLKAHAHRMRLVDRAWRHPDGLLPLLGDTVLKGTPIKRGRPVPRIQRFDDHVVYTDAARGDFLLFDGGPMGVDHCGAHMHNDLLGFELSLAGRRIISDGGGGHYADSPQRSAMRGAREHANVTVNDVECGEPWKSFRMGRRGKALSLRISENPKGPIEMVAVQSGFAPCGVLHKRRVRIQPDQRVFHFTEKLLPMKGQEPPEVLRLRVFLPLFPGLTIEAENSKSWLLKSAGNARARLFVESHLREFRLREESGVVYQDFGVPCERVILVLEGETVPGRPFSYSLTGLD